MTLAFCFPHNFMYYRWLLFKIQIWIQFYMTGLTSLTCFIFMCCVITHFAFWSEWSEMDIHGLLKIHKGVYIKWSWGSVIIQKIQKGNNEPSHFFFLFLKIPCWRWRNKQPCFWLEEANDSTKLFFCMPIHAICFHMLPHLLLVTTLVSRDN